MNRIQAQFTALRYLALDGADHASHGPNTIRGYTKLRNNYTTDSRPRKVIASANIT